MRCRENVCAPGEKSATDEVAATNEELVGANEELQGTNEELQSAQEELQSMNQELSMVNDELRNRNQALDLVASDLANILESVQVPIIILDGELRVRRFTPMARMVSNLIPGDLGRLIEDVKLKVQVENLTEKIKETIETHTPKEWEIQGVDGRWLRLQIRPYRGADGRLDGVLLSFIDVDVLTRALQAAESARDYARGIVETVQTALVVIDPKLRVVSANRAFYAVCGGAPNTTEGAGFFELLAGVWQGSDVSEPILRSVTERTSFHDLAIRREFPGLGRRELSLSGLPIIWEGGSLMLLLAIENITEHLLFEEGRTRLLSAAQQARVEAERANHAKDLFLATLSHELRTPLSAILTSAQVLKQASPEDSVSRRTSNVIERAVRAQARLIEDLLDISRIVSGKLHLDLQAVDLAMVVRSAVDVARGPAEAKEIALKVTISDPLGLIYGDAARMQQVVANLLANSIKFTPRGGKIELCLDSTGSYAQLVVSDTGMGITAEMMPQLFERFVQADSAMTRSHGGLGLGLAIVRHLVQIHGGEVRAESPGAGRGAKFRVLLPFAAHASMPPAAPDPGAAIHSIDGVRVLLIDDEDDTREAFAAALATFGADVFGAASALAGLAAVKKWRPQVILCDLAMPGEDGYSFIYKLRSLTKNWGGQIPTGALTALAGVENRQRALSAGFQLHLVKPIDSEQLAAAIGVLADWSRRVGSGLLPVTGPARAPQHPLRFDCPLPGQPR